MKRLPVLLALVSVCAFAGEEWPKKGDTIYVSARFTEAFPPVPFMGGGQTVVVEPCSMLTVASDRLLLKDDAGGQHQLLGDWSVYLHTDHQSCKAAVDKWGLPRVLAQGWKLRLAEPDKAQH